MADYTEVTNESWFGRIGGSIKGIISGVVMVGAAFMLLFWNEGRAVKRYKTLKEGAGAVVPVSADTVQAANDGRLVHLSGEAVTAETLSDPVFGVSAQALRLMREVEMYQWKEIKNSRKKKKLGGGTETVTDYTYEKQWSKSLISSASFKKSSEHRNPTAMPYKTETYNARDAHVGAFRLTPGLLAQLSGFQPVMPRELPPAVQAKASIQGDSVYIGADAGAPKVGDVRIRFRAVNPGPVSIVATQVGDTFEPYHSKSGGSILMLKAGTLSADAMFQQAKSANKTMTTVLRVLGFILMFLGFSTILKPLSVIADVVPFIGSLVGAGTGLVALLVASALSMVTIGVAWIVYRPLLGVGLLAVAGGLTFVVKTRMKKAPAPAAEAG